MEFQKLSENKGLFKIESTIIDETQPTIALEESILDDALRRAIKEGKRYLKVDEHFYYPIPSKILLEVEYFCTIKYQEIKSRNDEIQNERFRKHTLKYREAKSQEKEEKSLILNKELNFERKKT